MNTIIVFCAEYLIFIFGLVALVYWLFLPKKQKLIVAIAGVITILVAYILARIGSGLFYDPRPFVSDHVVALFKHVADNGFPSDHTLVTASIAAAIFMVSKKWGLGLLAGSIIIGTARVLANVHRPIDIIASLIFAAIGAAVAYYLTPKILARLSNKRFLDAA